MTTVEQVTEPLAQHGEGPVWRASWGGLRCDPDGRIYCGSMAYDGRPSAGALYRLDPEGQVDVVLRGVSISNGLAWSPDVAWRKRTATAALRRPTSSGTRKRPT